MNKFNIGDHVVDNRGDYGYIVDINYEVLPKKYRVKFSFGTFWQQENELTIKFNNENTMKINIGSFKCEVEYDEENNKVRITNRKYSFEATYFGDIEKWIKNNTPMIESFFINHYELETEGIMEEFAAAFSKANKKLKVVLLPNTREILIATIMKTFVVEIKEVANLCKDPTYNTMLKDIFSKK